MVDIPQESRLVVILSSYPVFTTEILSGYSISPREDLRSGCFPGESLHPRESRILVVSLSGLWILTTVLRFISIRTNLSFVIGTLFLSDSLFSSKISILDVINRVFVVP